jgi:acyl carrier protein
VQEPVDTNTSERIRRYISEDLLYDEGADALLSEDAQILSLLDSLGLMQLVTFIEQDLGVPIDQKDITPENFATLRDIERLVREKAKRD